MPYIIYCILPVYLQHAFFVFFFIVNRVIVSLYHYRVMSTETRIYVVKFPNVGQHTVSHAELP